MFYITCKCLNVYVDVNTEVHSDIVISKPFGTAKVVWVHPQSELVSVHVVITIL